MCTKLEAATLSGDQVPPLFVGVSELEYEMVSKTIALRMRVQIPLPTPPLKWVDFSQMILHQKNFFTDEIMIDVYNELIIEILHNRENADIEKILRETLLRYGA